MRLCSIPDCGAKSHSTGLCAAHYRRQRKYGDPHMVKQVQRHGLTLEERFWSYVERGPTCWEWQGHCDPNGYGRINFPGHPAYLAHRLSFELANSRKLEKGECVCHRCDNPSCVRPEHLFSGSQEENLRDMTEKGRRRYGTTRGVDHPKNKLTEEQARHIRDSDIPATRLAKEYGITQSSAWAIRARKTWKHLN